MNVKVQNKNESICTNTSILHNVQVQVYIFGMNALTNSHNNGCMSN